MKPTLMHEHTNSSQKENNPRDSKQSPTEFHQTPTWTKQVKKYPLEITREVNKHTYRITAKTITSRTHVAVSSKMLIKKQNHRVGVHADPKIKPGINPSNTRTISNRQNTPNQKRQRKQRRRRAYSSFSPSLESGLRSDSEKANNRKQQSNQRKKRRRKYNETRICSLLFDRWKIRSG